MTVSLYPHQQKAVDDLGNGKILLGGVGDGKSRTAMAYFVSKVCGGTYDDPGSMTTPKDVYVITTAKKRDSLDWDKEAQVFGIGRHTASSRSNITLHVDSWNNLKNYTEVKDAFFIFDEQRVVGYGSWSRAFIKIAKHNEWILLSATPGDTWLDYLPVFIANGWYKHKTDFVEQHVIWQPYVKYNKVQRYTGLGTLVRRRNEVLVQMPFTSHTKRISEYIECAYNEVDFEKVSKKRWNIFENRPIRDVAEQFAAMRKVVNSDDSRLEAVRTLLQVHPKLIVFYNFDYELQKLRQLGASITSESSGSTTTGQTPTRRVPRSGKQSESLPSSTPTGSSFAIAEWNGHKHEEIPANCASWVYLVQYRAGAEGWNCIETDAMVFYSQTYSYRDWWQAHGRIDRLNTPFTNLYYYHLISKSIIDKAIKAALKVKKNFNERDLAF